MRKSIKLSLVIMLIIVVFAVALIITGCTVEQIALVDSDYSPIYLREMPIIKLADSGKFNILHLSDMHLVGTKKDRWTLNAIDKQLADNDYDLVVLGGDVVEGNAKINYNKPKAIADLIAIFDKNSQPFTLSFGNNDGEMLGSNEQIAIAMTASKNFVYADTENVGGTGNFYISLVNGNNVEKHRLVIVDSRMRDQSGKYYHISDDQISWYNSTASAVANAGIKLSMFMHIPFDSFTIALESGVAYPSYESINKLGNIRANGNGNAPLYDAVVESGVCGMVASGHYHNVEAAILKDNIYHKVTRTGGNFSNINKPLKYGGSEIVIDTTQTEVDKMYDFKLANYK